MLKFSSKLNFNFVLTFDLKNPTTIHKQKGTKTIQKWHRYVSHPKQFLPVYNVCVPISQYAACAFVRNTTVMMNGETRLSLIRACWDLRNSIISTAFANGFSNNQTVHNGCQIIGTIPSNSERQWIMHASNAATHYYSQSKASSPGRHLAPTSSRCPLALHRRNKNPFVGSCIPRKYRNESSGVSWWRSWKTAPRDHTFWL